MCYERLRGGGLPTRSPSRSFMSELCPELSPVPEYNTQSDITLHRHYIYITSTLHLHYIYITYTLHLHYIYITYTYTYTIYIYIYNIHIHIHIHIHIYIYTYTYITYTLHIHYIYITYTFYIEFHCVTYLLHCIPIFCAAYLLLHPFVRCPFVDCIQYKTLNDVRSHPFYHFRSRNDNCSTEAK